MNIQKSIEINASPEKLWNVLLLDAYNKIWYAEFNPGSYAETDWKEGSKVFFKDNSGDGLAGKVSIHKPNEILSVTYHGITQKGQEFTEGDEAQNWLGKTETYKATRKGNGTLLTVELDVPPEYLDMFEKMWDKALVKIKELAEQ